MKFYFYDRIRNGRPREMKMDEVQEHLSPAQIDAAIAAKKEAPNDDVSYMTRGGYIVEDI